MFGVGARERMVGDKFTLYLMDGSECIIEVKPHRTKVNSIWSGSSVDQNIRIYGRFL